MVKNLVQVNGEGSRKAKLMIVGKAPGKDEIVEGRPFVGRAGKFLRKALIDTGIDARTTYITNIVKFRPTKSIEGKVKDRRPTENEIRKYLPYFEQELREVNPKYVLLLGKTAVKATVGQYFLRNLREYHGKQIKVRDILYIPTYHPANALRNRMNRKLFMKDLFRLKTIMQKS